MEDLSNRIYSYYFEHFGSLPADKQFHLASRLYLWGQDPLAVKRLEGLKPYFTANNQPVAALDEVIALAQASPVHGSKNAAALRRPYFEQYPKLKTYLAALFRVTWLKQAYGIDIRQAFFDRFPKPELEAFYRRLLDDPAAIAMLSTHAVNFLYLYGRVLLENEDLFDPAYFIEIAANYDRSDRLHLQLLIYLYTHCLIGDSKFYFRPPPDKPVYRQMIKELEGVIEARFADINLDNKFEFLVCAKLLGTTSRLEPRIFEEAGQSLSETGDFLIDRHNNNPQTDNSDLGASEHRNVLFLMAGRDFKPLG